MNTSSASTVYNLTHLTVISENHVFTNIKFITSNKELKFVCIFHFFMTLSEQSGGS